MDRDWSDLREKLDAVQAWIDGLRQAQATETTAISTDAAIVVREVLDLIQQDPSQGSSDREFSETYADLEKQIQQQTAELTRATDALKRQIVERETSATRLRKAYNDLETHLQEHLADRSRLNLRLQAQIAEYRRIEALEREERALTDALRNTLATMSTTLDLDKILDHILDTIKQVTPYDGANVLLVEPDLVHVVRQRGYTEAGRRNGRSNQRLPTSALAVLQQLINLGEPLAIADTTTSPMWIGFPDLDWVNSNVIVPIRSEQGILGFLSLDSATPGFFNQSHAEKLQAFADQVAIAIQNARLHDRAKRAAIVAERSRLASEIHDTISQTLWSMSLISERLPAIWDRDREQGGRSLIILRQLAQNALVEMRSLLLELHPASLTDAKLGDLIRQTAEITTNRTGLSISVQVGEQDSVPQDVHFALYRAVQEALNNVALHASASHVEVNFSSHLGRLDLTIQDDGVGFDWAEVGPDRFGLSIMKDRIQKIGGTLEIESSEGNGTLIRLSWEAPRD